jgi:O-antigen/teichoic acid export membrane protein
MTTTAQPHHASSLKNLVATNAAISVGARVFYMMTRFLLPPLILRHISLELYGVWATCFIVIGYFGMSAFGVSNVYIRYVAGYHVNGKWTEINRLLSTGIAVTLAVSVVLLTGLWLVLPQVVSSLKISPPFQHTAVILIFGTAATFVLDLSLGAFGHVLTALQRVAESTAIWLASVIFETVLIVVMIGRWGVYALLFAFTARYVFVTIASIVLCRRVLPQLTIGVRYFDRAALRLFYSYGGVVQLSGILGMVLYSIEKIIAGVFLGVAATGIFDLGEKFAVMGSQVASSMNGVLMPAAAHLHARDERTRLVDLYVKSSRYLSILAALISGFLPAFAAPLMAFWLGADPRIAGAATILMLFALPFHIHVLTGPGSAIHRATDRPARELVYPLTQLALVAVTVGIGFSYFGRTIAVVAVAVSSSMLASQLGYMAYSNRMLGVSQRLFTRRVLAPSLVPYAVAGLLALVAAPALRAASTDRLSLLLVLAPCALAYLMVSAAIFWWDAEPGERGQMAALMSRRRRSDQATTRRNAELATGVADARP